MVASGGIDLFHVGPQKAGTTWLYGCLHEHPEVAVPSTDAIHYFDIHYHRGSEWLYGHFADAGVGQKLIDPTHSYLRSPRVPERIRAVSPHARIALTMRHPVTRAFSHYWHEKKKGRHDFRFEEVLENYDLYASWLEPGFYSMHIERFLEHFPREQLLAQRFERMGDDPGGFLSELFAFYGIDPDFRPSILYERRNVAQSRAQWRSRRARARIRSAGRRVLTAVGLDALRRPGRRLLETVAEPFEGPEGRIERLADQPPTLLEDLMAICLPEIERLERLLDIDLSAWRSLDLQGEPER